MSSKLTALNEITCMPLRALLLFLFENRILIIRFVAFLRLGVKNLLFVSVRPRFEKLKLFEKLVSGNHHLYRKITFSKPRWYFMEMDLWVRGHRHVTCASATKEVYPMQIH